MTDLHLDRAEARAGAHALREALREDDRLRRAEGAMAQAMAALDPGTPTGPLAADGARPPAADPTPDDERAAGRRDGVGTDLIDGGTDRPGV